MNICLTSGGIIFSFVLALVLGLGLGMVSLNECAELEVDISEISCGELSDIIQSGRQVTKPVSCRSYSTSDLGAIYQVKCGGH